MQSSRTRQRLVILLLTVLQMLIDVSADEHRQPVQEIELTSLEDHSNKVDEEEENTTRDVANYSLTHTVDEYTNSQPLNPNMNDKKYKNGVYRKGNSTGENATEAIQVSETGDFSNSDPGRFVEVTTMNQNTNHTETNSENRTGSGSVSRNNEHNQEAESQSQPADAANTPRVKSTIRDWFLELTKRINRPSWLMSQPDTSTGVFNNQTRPLSGYPERAFNSTNTLFSRYITMTNSEGNLTRESSELGQAESRVGNYADNLSLSGNAYKQASEHRKYNSLDNKTKDNDGELLITEPTDQETSDSRLPLMDNSTLDSFLVDEYSNSTANDVRRVTEDLHASNDSSECPSCRKQASAEELIKSIRLDMFKNLLVQKLRWDPASLSDSSGGRLDENIPIIPDSLVEQTLRDNAREYERDEFHARDQELIIAGEDMGRDCIKLHVTGCYSFQLKGRIRGDVAEAQLWLYKMEDANDVAGQTLTLYELERLKSGRLYHSSMISSVDTMTKQGWVELNVTRSLMKWVDKRKGTKLIAIRCVTCATRGHRALYGAKHGYRPLLIVKYVKDTHLLRGKRSTSCDPRYECCKLELLVNFHEIGMSHILQPRQLSVGYCFGECNENHVYTSNHTIIRQRVRWSEPLANQHSMKQQLKPCCVPVILKDIFIMTSDGDGSIVRKLLPKVVVETCGCM